MEAYKLSKNIENVQPLRKKEDISTVQYFLRQGTYGSRNSLIFLIGINTGLRCIDIVSLKVGTVRTNKMPFVVEQKTSKKRQVNLQGIAKEIDDYILEQGFTSDNDYLFPSRKEHIIEKIKVKGCFPVVNSKGLDNSNYSKLRYEYKFIYQHRILLHSMILPLKKAKHGHITVKGFYRVITKVGEQMNRSDLGTHTMRKTFGYHFYRQTNDIMLLSHILNHSSPSITARYIGITDDEINKNLTHFRLG
ncbi:hypothetical protein DY052_07570 [Apilactobacillus timberlakei]|nr:hypothetical protein DY052_07570 [Apilactobacillus timberlakei]